MSHERSPTADGNGRSTSETDGRSKAGDERQSGRSADGDSADAASPTDTGGETRADGTTASRAEAGPTAADLPDLDEGRYVYCVVRVEGEDPGDGVEIRGIEAEPVSVIDADGIGAVVHDCERVYDSADPVEIRRWLVRHQRVVDAAGETFGTPLPFQFDTIIRGDDAVVRDWLQRERASLERALEALTGHWEYRIDLVRTEPIDRDRLVAGDDSLASLREEIEDAERGRAHLLEKRFESRLRERRRERRERLSRQLRECVSPHVRELHELEREPSAGLGGDEDDEQDADGVTICRLTVLAHEDDETALGDALDEIAARDGIEIRFTGPWPPYTFTPTFGEDGPDGRR